jgi:hypothetical protein
MAVDLIPMNRQNLIEAEKELHHRGSSMIIQRPPRITVRSEPSTAKVIRADRFAGRRLGAKPRETLIEIGLSATSRT